MNLSFFLFPFLIAIFSQRQTQEKLNISVEKVSCDSKFKFGEKLVIRIGSGKEEKVSPLKNYDLKDFIKLTDAEKLSIVAQLLKYRDDNSETCLLPFNFNYSKNNKSNTQKSPAAKAFSIKVDALYMINRLCFFEAPYYTWPVIVDARTGAEVNDNAAAISEYYKVYDEWLKECLQKGVIDKVFPFNTNTYKWYH